MIYLICTLLYFILGILFENRLIKYFTEKSKISYIFYLFLWLPFQLIVLTFLIFNAVKITKNNKNKKKNN